jgi:hypothetical protein
MSSHCSGCIHRQPPCHELQLALLLLNQPRCGLVATQHGHLSCLLLLLLLLLLVPDHLYEKGIAWIHLRPGRSCACHW